MVAIADIINTILQCIMFIFTTNYCVEDRYKKSKIQMIFYITLLFIVVEITTLSMGNSSLGAVIIHLVILISGSFLYKKDSLGASIGFSIVYFAIGINLLIFTNLYFLLIQPMIPPTYAELGMVIVAYLPQYIMSYFILSHKDVIYKFYRSIRTKNNSIISLMIMTVVVDFLASFNLIIHDKDNPLFKEIIFLLLGVFIIGITVYFSKVEKRAKEIAVINDALEQKVNELKKVKHDYGAQISYLYGLHLMGKYDRLGVLLKDIINGHNNIVSEVSITNDKDSIIAMAVSGIDRKGINVIIDEQATLEYSSMSEMEIQRVISNIVRNSITAMNGKGILSIKTYYSFNDIVIKIQNDGPKIDDKIIDKIFNVGFTTKENCSKNHGFGLAIVKEILEHHNGKIAVSSTFESTDFVIKLPKVAQG